MKKININKKNLKKSLMCLGLSGALVLGTISAGPYIDFKNQSLGLRYVNTKNIHMSSEEFLAKFQEIYQNSPTLQDEWSSFYPELCDFISVYGEYLDQEEFLDTIHNLSFVYGDTSIEKQNLIAQYHIFKNSIHYSDNIQSKKRDEVKEVSFHETIHYFFHQNFTFSFMNLFLFGNMLDEGNASMITREYNDYVGVDCYDKAVDYVRVLCELIGSDNYMKAACGHDVFQLVSYLSEYTSYTKALLLLPKIDIASRFYNSKGTSFDKAAWNIIEEMYYNKYGISIEDSDDDIMKYYSNRWAGTEYIIQGGKYNHNFDLQKNYFVNIGDAVLSYKDGDGNYHSVVLDDNSPYIKS